MRLLEDENWYVRRAAAEALGKLGDARAIEPFKAAQAREEGVPPSQMDGACRSPR
jgi:HEAT repeat protein